MRRAEDRSGKRQARSPLAQEGRQVGEGWPKEAVIKIGGEENAWRKKMRMRQEELRERGK